jgi:hypothetical protein
MATGGKWSWSDAEVHAILQAFTGTQTVRDRAWFAPGVIWGYRISELMSLKVKDVYDVETSSIREFLTGPACRLNGGKPHAPKPQPPKPTHHDPTCRCNRCHPKCSKRRPLMTAVSPWARHGRLSKPNSIGSQRPGTAWIPSATSLKAANGLAMAPADRFPRGKRGTRSRSR